MEIKNMSDLRAIGLVLSGYATAKDDDFLHKMSNDILFATLPEGSREGIDREIAAVNEGWEVSEDTSDAPDQPTQEPQEEGGDVEPVEWLVKYGIDRTGDTDVLSGLGTSMSAGLVDEGADADLDSPIIGSFSEVSDEAVKEAGGDPVSRVDALNTAAQIVPDFGPIES